MNGAGFVPGRMQWEITVKGQLKLNTHGDAEDFNAPFTDEIMVLDYAGRFAFPIM